MQDGFAAATPCECRAASERESLLVSGVTLFLVRALLAMLGFLTIDVPVPETWLFFVFIVLLIIAHRPNRSQCQLSSARDPWMRALPMD